MKNKKLHSVKKSGFETPNNYFETFEEQLLRNIKLSETVEKSGFKTPEDYFETFEDKFQQTFEKQNNTKVIALFNWKQVASVAAIAACLLLMFTLFYPQQDDLAFEDIETVAIENYLDARDYSTDDFAALISEETLSKKNFINQDIDEAQLENYLLDVDLEEFLLN